jgi:hypothetical protein
MRRQLCSAISRELLCCRVIVQFFNIKACGLSCVDRKEAKDVNACVISKVNDLGRGLVGWYFSQIPRRREWIEESYRV